VLEKVDAQHPLQTDRRAAVAGFRIDRFDQPAQAAPRHHALHLRQKRRPARRLAVALEPRRRKRHLLHRRKPCGAIRPSFQNHNRSPTSMTFSEFP
jgi:hypothetical protein